MRDFHFICGRQQHARAKLDKVRGEQQGEPIVELSS